MSGGDKMHTRAIAALSKRMIRAARPGRRNAFAIGTIDNFTVMLAKRGNPTSALGELGKLALPADMPTSGKKSKFMPLISGLLYFEGKVLVLQTKKKPARGHISKARGYFIKMHVGAPWNKLELRPLREHDEGETDDEDDLSPIDLAEDADSEEEGEEEIKDGWGNEGAEEDSDAKDPAEPGDAPAAPAVDAVPAADVQRVTGLLDTLAPRLKLVASVSDDALRQTVAELLAHVPVERLLLMLCSNPNIEHLATAAREGRLDTETDVPAEPIANDEAGRGKIADAVAALGKRIGSERGLVEPEEKVNPGTHLAAMVQQKWTQKPALTPEQLISELVGTFGTMFDTADATRLRKLLGLHHDVWRNILAGLRGAWVEDVSEAVAGVDKTKEGVRNDPARSDQSVITAAIGMLDGVTAKMDAGVAAVLATLQDAVGAQLSPLLDGAASQLATARSFLETDEVATELDNNEFAPGLQIVKPLIARLDSLQALLERASSTVQR